MDFLLLTFTDTSSFVPGDLSISLEAGPCWGSLVWNAQFQGGQQAAVHQCAQFKAGTCWWILCPRCLCVRLKTFGSLLAEHHRATELHNSWFPAVWKISKASLNTVKTLKVPGLPTEDVCTKRRCTCSRAMSHGRRLRCSAAAVVVVSW